MVVDDLELLDDDQVAEVLALKTSTLRNMRSAGSFAIRHLRVGRKALYFRRDVASFAASRQREHARRSCHRDETQNESDQSHRS